MKIYATFILFLYDNKKINDFEVNQNYYIKKFNTEDKKVLGEMLGKSELIFNKNHKKMFANILTFIQIICIILEENKEKQGVVSSQFLQRK